MAPQHSPATDTPLEKRADACVHLIGVPAGIAGTVVLIAVTALGSEWTRLLAVVLYGLGLVGMLVGSAAYNLTEDPARRERLRPLDHAGIFVMIAGTYTPFTLISVGGWTGAIYCLVMWLAAAGGVILKLRWPRKYDGVSVGLYLAMGWSVLALAPQLVAGVSGAVLGLLLAGGVVYTAGVPFHLAKRLRFHKAVWHAFVLAAAGLHYAAVLKGIALDA